ncbi:MAG TPA: hypothetical protein VHB50_14180 [Bryobacteraceae bacterium]|nr:hypothetical protein [Bryobacteraceae bacterium]
MITPLEISFQNTRPIGEVETRIRQELAEIEKSFHDIVSCHVDVEVPEHERRGSVSKVRIDVGFPQSHLAVGASGAPETSGGAQHLEVNAEHKDISMAVHAAFNAARRRLAEL